MRMAAYQHALDRGGDKGVLEILGQKSESLRHRATLELRERLAVELHLAAGGEPDRQLAHQLAGAGAHAHGARREPVGGGALSVRQGRVHRISRAVSGPTTTLARLGGISNRCADNARLPAMISASACGYRGLRSGSAYPEG